MVHQALPEGYLFSPIILYRRGYDFINAQRRLFRNRTELTPLFILHFSGKAVRCWRLAIDEQQAAKSQKHSATTSKHLSTR